MTAQNAPQRPWTDPDDATLRILYKQITARAIGEILGRTRSAIKNRAQTLGLAKPGENNGSFRKGMTPWNKGSHYVAGGRSAQTRFKAGTRNGRAAQLWQPIGAERVTKDGYLERKLTDTGVTRRDYVPVHHIVWRAAGFDIPPGHALCFKDGNKKNIVIANLELITRAALMLRNSCHNHGPEIAQIVQLRGAIARQINQRKEAA